MAPRFVTPILVGALAVAILTGCGGQSPDSEAVPAQAESATVAAPDTETVEVPPDPEIPLAGTQDRKPPPCRPPRKWQGDDIEPATVAKGGDFSTADAYRTECQVCRVFTPSQVAEEYNITSTNAAEIALEYAQISYRPFYQQPGFEGCLKGFSLSGQL